MNQMFCRTFTQNLTGIVACGVLLNGFFSTPLGAQETLAGVSAGSAAAAGLGAMGATVAVTETTRRARNGAPQPPGMGVDETGAPIADVTGGGPGFPGSVTTTTTVVRQQPVRWTTRTGEQIISELVNTRRPRTSRATTAARRSRARAQAAEARRYARMTPAQRRKALAARYRKPPVGWLAYYLPQDRYKLTSGIWKYVTIEDDPRDYPVRYYYSPSSSSMIGLLSRSPKGIRRYNRVIGFNSWQDAMLAGYRPDPVSQPAPGAQLASLARMTRGPQLARYAEFIYSGQVDPISFNASYQYLVQVQRTVNSRSYTRPLLQQTMDQVLSAIMGEGPMPTTVGGPPPPPPTAAGEFGGVGDPGVPGGDPGMGRDPGMPADPGMMGGPDAR